MKVEKALDTLRRCVPEFECLVLDEIYTYIGAKPRKHYVFTAYGITDMGCVVRYAKAFNHQTDEQGAATIAGRREAAHRRSRPV